MTPEQLRRGFHNLAERLYCDSFTQYRRDAFRQYRRGARIELADV
jgi:hypothetical protein